MLDKSPTKDESLLDWDEAPAPTEGSAWKPPDEVIRHNGDPLPPEMAFFAPPPEEIGPILSAESSLRVTDRPPRPASRILLIGFAGSALYGGLSALEAPGGVQLIGALIAAGLVSYFTRFRHHLSYVGAEGLATFSCRGRPDRIVKSQVFPFEEAATLHASQTRQYYNGIYSGTAYSYAWKNEAGKKRFKLSGSYYSEKKPPKPKNPFHFADSAELAWSLRLFALAQRDLERDGRIVFKLGGSNWIALGPGFIEFSKKEGPQRWTVAEIGDIQIGDGQVKFKHVDAKEGWFRSEGVFAFSYAQMANARLFLIALERLFVPSAPS